MPDFHQRAVQNEVFRAAVTGNPQLKALLAIAFSLTGQPRRGWRAYSFAQAKPLTARADNMPSAHESVAKLLTATDATVRCAL